VVCLEEDVASWRMFCPVDILKSLLDTKCTV